jgi:hypothetical protein
VQTVTTRPIAVQGIVPGAGDFILPISRVEQAQSEWCWAACGEMIAKHLYYKVNQCMFANAYLKGKAFCVDACLSPGKCNYPCQVDKIAGVYAQFQIACTFVGQPASPSRLAQEIIDAKQPIMAKLTFDNGAGHVVLLTGYSQNESGKVYVIDTRADYGEGWLDYETLVQAHGYGAWTASWIGIS